MVDDEFREAIQRMRAGDEQAAADLVREYEPLIRREVRMHLVDARLRRVFDSLDVEQSVLASFFVRAAAGEYDLDSPAQLAALLVRMVQNKLASTVRKQYRRRRDARRTESNEQALYATVVEESTVSEQLANRELLEALQQQLSREELEIARLRGAGLSWEEVAAEVGGKAHSRRMQLSRAVERAARNLGLAKTYE